MGKESYSRGVNLNKIVVGGSSGAMVALNLTHESIHQKTPAPQGTEERVQEELEASDYQGKMYRSFRGADQSQAYKDFSEQYNLRTGRNRRAYEQRVRRDECGKPAQDPSMQCKP